MPSGSPAPCRYAGRPCRRSGRRTVRRGMRATVTRILIAKPWANAPGVRASLRSAAVPARSVANTLNARLSRGRRRRRRARFVVRHGVFTQPSTVNAVPVRARVDTIPIASGGRWSTSGVSVGPGLRTLERMQVLQLDGQARTKLRMAALVAPNPSRRPGACDRARGMMSPVIQ